MTIDRWIAEAAARHPEKPALVFDGDVLDYAGFAARIALREAELRGAGVGRGDRVAWYGLNHPEVFVLLFACARIGAILVPLNWRLAEAEVAAIVANCAPEVVVHDDDFAAPARRLGVPAVHVSQPVPGVDRELPVDPEAPGLPRAAPPDRGPDQPSADAGAETDPVLLVYTSGATGRPKGAVLTQAALAANAEMSVQCHAMTAEDSVLNVLPLFHVGGLNIIPTPAFSLGATVHLHARFDPAAMVRDLQKVHCAITVPTVLQAVLADPGWAAADLSGLRVLSIGSTDVPVDLIERAQARGVPVCQVYGATETGPFAIYQTVDEAMATTGSLGRVGRPCAVRLVSDGRDVAPGEPGEIWVKGPNVLREYWGDPELTAAMLRDGWFRTGDVAVRDERGLYWFTDRIKHVVISGGENIYPAEIERVLRTHPGVREVAVVGQPDPKWGEIPVAVIAGEPLTLDEVRAFLEGRIARYKLPRAVRLVEALPRNAMGKVVAAEVRAMLADDPTCGGGA
ncbi:AMP-binding protein [Psychromarinibacter sp. C21-152]|uniref:AMP-binding protein n=1 Tax=Psychromarinibacter sediminicola TaxID=3033385 RepID=A0AAE3NU65_9RHOB|nr:AMP-binding protein [Psychromarinibacter sediminicola]MDF0603598.1 AMP-binding protein [Psychromarinibacter sediminicola]